MMLLFLVYFPENKYVINKRSKVATMVLGNEMHLKKWIQILCYIFTII